MDLCPGCGKRLPYFAVLRTCLLRQEVAITCPSCGTGLVSGTPLLGIQALWIGGGVLLVFRQMAGFSGDSTLAGAAALAFWIAAFWLAAPWLCRFGIARPASPHGATPRIAP